MPLYEYKCSSCGRVFDKLQKFSDPPLTDCECGATGTVSRLMSTPSFHLKGGGWYKDGYGSGKSASAASPSGSPANSESKGEPKSSGDSSASTSSTPSSTASDSKPAA